MVLSYGATALTANWKPRNNTTVRSWGVNECSIGMIAFSWVVVSSLRIIHITFIGY